VVHPLNQCDFWRCCDTEATWAAMTPAAPPDKGMLVGVPVTGGTLHAAVSKGCRIWGAMAATDVAVSMYQKWRDTVGEVAWAATTSNYGLRQPTFTEKKLLFRGR